MLIQSRLGILSLKPEQDWTTQGGEEGESESITSLPLTTIHLCWADDDRWFQRPGFPPSGLILCPENLAVVNRQVPLGRVVKPWNLCFLYTQLLKPEQKVQKEPEKCYRKSRSRPQGKTISFGFILC